MPTASSTPTDPFDLDRFVKAQHSVYDDVLCELKAGRKQSHWMWFVFPQIAGLGQSPTARRFSIVSHFEAEAYLAHAALGPRLAECTSLVLDIDGKTAQTIFGDPDWMKFHSSMTLFADASPGESLFTRALDNYFCGVPDASTLTLLERSR